ncbi:alpha-L-fucosidase [bacterium]|nr:alpha-L-fucosidase [bacterium]
MKKLTCTLFLLATAGALFAQAQEHPDTRQAYMPPTDPLVIEKLDQWRDLKFGFMMHWGLYAQLGIVESWALCSEDQPFQDRKGVPYTEFKEMYFSQIEHFNPVDFDPEPWAQAVQDAGMRYVVFTTKHHDGFCMWDTKETDFRITGPASPFRDNPRANIAKEIFAAFRKKGFMIGTYFSKPDWHSPDYWSPLWATPDRCNNYDVCKYPGMWQRFKDFTCNQIEELMTTLGPVDILWLDGGWVRPDSTITDEVRSWGYRIPDWEQDIDMPRIVTMARGRQPGLIVVNRSVHGPYEDYRTPEQHVPADGLPYPWETCMTMTANWGYVPGARYKSAEQIVKHLVDIVAKGGNYLLNIGPTPRGTLEPAAYQRLREIGAWMKVNGSAIYATRMWNTYGQGEAIRFTRSKDGGTLNVFAMEWPGSRLLLTDVQPGQVKKVVMLGDGNPLQWDASERGMVILLPGGLREKGRHVWTFQITLDR